MYGNKSTIHRLHLKLCEIDAYGKIFDEMKTRGYLMDKIDLSRCNIDNKNVPAKKGEIGYDGNKKIKGIKISVITENHGLPIALFISRANIYDSKLYMPTILDLKTIVLNATF